MDKVLSCTILAQLILLLLSEKIIWSVLGEFGIVYKGHITANQGKVVTKTVAIKTLKGIYTRLLTAATLEACTMKRELSIKLRLQALLGTDC